MECDHTDLEDECYVYPAVTKRYSQIELRNPSEPTSINIGKSVPKEIDSVQPDLPPRTVTYPLQPLLKTRFHLTSELSDCATDLQQSQGDTTQKGNIQSSRSCGAAKTERNVQTGLHLSPTVSSANSNNTTPTPSFPLLSVEHTQMSKRTSIQQLRKYSVVDPNTLKYFDDTSGKSGKFDVCSALLITISYVIVILTFPLSLLICIKVVAEYERVVVFRLGRILPRGARGPGLFFVAPCIDSIRKVDLRTVTFDVPPQEVLTKDSVTVAVDAVVYYRIYNPVVAITNVEDADRSTRLLAATTLRNVLGTKDLAEILSERESISASMQTMLDDATDPWGVKVERVEVKDVRLPVQLQRAMAAEAEATREARAKVIAAEGEEKSSVALKQAADVLKTSPFALHLRYLQTLSAISAERNSTIIFPLPIDMLTNLMRR